MLLRLVPEQPLPTILFTLAFGNLPDGVPFPQNWTAQLQHILQDELEMPSCIHALDKAAWAACLLHEVTFNVAARTVSCLFVDGTRVEWPLVDKRFRKALQEVMDDVNESAVASEMETRRTKAIQMAAQAAEAAPTRPSTPVSSKQKHKKSRSLLMTLVASFCPSSQPSSPSLLPIDSPLPLTAIAPPPPEPPHSSRSLRRKARAALVDIYRQYILPSLDSPFSLSSGAGSGYVLWNLQSILRRIDMRMHALSREFPASSTGTGVHRDAIRASPSPSMTPEEDDDSSASGTTEGSTETDASSVHTPRDSYAEYPLMCRVNGDDNLVASERGIASPASPLSPSPSSPPSPSSRTRSHRTKSPPSTTTHTTTSTSTSSSLAEFALLHASTIRLRSLIHRVEASTSALAAERAAQLAALEVRSRRRAWSARQLVGGAPREMAGILGVPGRGKGSPLRWAVETFGEELGMGVGMQVQGMGQGMGRGMQGEGMGRREGKGRCLGVPRMPGGRLATRRMMSRKTAAEYEYEYEREDEDEVALRVPSQAGCVPFPQTEVGDDFCSTGPQDTTPLFGGLGDGDVDGDVDGDGDDEELYQGKNRSQNRSQNKNKNKSPASRSSHDLPSLLSLSLSSSAPEDEINFPYLESFVSVSDSGSEEAEGEAYAFDPPCDEFARSVRVDSEHFKEAERGVPRAVRTRANVRRRRDAAPALATAPAVVGVQR